MCMGIPQLIIAINDDMASIQYRDRVQEAKMPTMEYNIGDYVFAQAGFILQKIEKEDAQKALALLEEL